MRSTREGVEARQGSTLAPVVPLLSEIGDLKRLRTADGEGSLAERSFWRSWAAVVAGEPASRVALRETAAAVAAARLGGIDARVLRRSGLDDLVAAVQLRPGQCGAIVALGGQVDVADHVSRPEVFATLHGPLVQGYALDALEAREAPAPSVDAVQDWLDRVLASPVTESDGIGLGRDVRFDGGAATGAGLVSGTELVQLTAFGSRDAHAKTTIRRPSRRRH